MSQIAIVYPSGFTRLTSTEKEARRAALKELGFDTTSVEPQHPSSDGHTAGSRLERAALFAHALTQRKYSTLWAARGGSGSTALIPFLENILPPVIPNKTLVGYSDVSFLGVYLTLRYPNFRYVHGNHVYDQKLLDYYALDKHELFNLIQGKVTKSYSFPSTQTSGVGNETSTFEGPLIPLNLTLAECLSSLPYITLPKKSILFLEDINEDFYRILRKFDTLINSGFLKNVQAIVLGNFTDCPDNSNKPLSELSLTHQVASITRLPTFHLPIFGHDTSRFPMVARSTVHIKNAGKHWTVTLDNAFPKPESLASDFDIALFRPQATHPQKPLNVHFTGIGGTGMAAVAGIFRSAGFSMTGSDNPIYPPMDAVIKELGITPQVGFTADNIKKTSADFIVLSNVITRLNGELKPNHELEEILANNTPVLSFPSALRKFFLHDSTNIVVSGTHGKTTTTSILSHCLDGLGENPSFIIGGTPKNFGKGFRLASKSLFVLEGDEYDTAFFDKGPKFLHYEPKISIINNIEFDHADIYDNVEAIELEFLRLASLTKARKGIVVGNYQDERVRRVCESSGAQVISFGTEVSNCAAPHWRLVSLKTEANGSVVVVESPDQKRVELKFPLFGMHNALNVVATFGALHALKMIKNSTFDPSGKTDETSLKNWKDALQNFTGVKRRFDLVEFGKDIAVFDDFAHHPTAVRATLKAFRDYMKASERKGRLIACFDPRNATMRRNVLADELAGSFSEADLVFIGKVANDLRLDPAHTLKGESVAEKCGPQAKYFADNDALCLHLSKLANPGDTFVFMSSGAFDGLPSKLSQMLFH